MSYKSKKDMYLKKKIDPSFPKHIMESILKWIDCYNSNIMEKVKNQMHYEFENRINDTSISTSYMKMSNSSKKSDNDSLKCEKDIFNWLSLMNDEDVDFYSKKLNEHMKLSQKYILLCVNEKRQENKKPSFNPNYKSVKNEKDESKHKDEEKKDMISMSNVKDVKKDTKEEKKDVKVLYGDAWDLL
jgi:hypothetical protein